jgi:hypothetical protein
MRYRLRTLVILTAVLPPMLAAAWVVLRDSLWGAVIVGAPVAAVLWDVYWDWREHRRSQSTP